MIDAVLTFFPGCLESLDAVFCRIRRRRRVEHNGLPGRISHAVILIRHRSPGPFRAAGELAQRIVNAAGIEIGVFQGGGRSQRNGLSKAVPNVLFQDGCVIRQPGGVAQASDKIINVVELPLPCAGFMRDAPVCVVCIDERRP